MTVIKVVDSIMGSGKTSAAINLMNKEEDRNFIFITPFLTEVERVKKSVTTKKFHEPKFYSKGGELYTKFDSLHKLLSNSNNIVSTHALFKRANEETKELIHGGNYTLILDEVMDVVEQLEIKKDDLKLLFDNELIYVEDGFIKWNEKKMSYDTRYNDIRDMALNNTLIYFRDTILIWTFPVDVFKAFKEVYILTYLFEAQIQKYYYDLYNMKYEKVIAVNENGEYIFKKDDANTYAQLKAEIKSKITIYDGNLNDIGDKSFSLSKSWYDDKSQYTIKKVKNNVSNYFKHKIKSNSHEAMWTTFIKHKGKLSGAGYTKGFVPCTARATNDFRHKKNLAYMINRYVNPILLGFMQEKGIKIDQDKFAVSELVQWIWRSAIRDNEEINLYIPSKRMRELLNKWMNNEL
ncbi:hypothetical protein AB1283_00680 [Bacillus sp. S13(2024)]|uniref:hypothetical protein n=1 Tax=Bacillus sp. S13(2024) TaxID=3162885 RepID=UPI003D234401